MKTIRSILEELDTKCPKCDGNGNGGDGCPYCWDNNVEKLAIDQALSEIKEIIQQKVIETKIEQSWRCRELIEANASSPYDEEKYGEIVLLDIDDLKDELSQLKHNKKGDSNGSN